MPSRKEPTHVYHFTHVDHLETIIEHGLLSDTTAQGRGLLSVEVGDLGIKDRRRQRPVPIPPQGAVADYVPFYFAPRSPMMYSIAQGNVSTYQGGTSRLIYVVTSLERLHELGKRPVLTDRNAALRYAAYREFDPDDMLDDGFVDWEVMQAQYWTEYDDGRERRMAECLVRDQVAWDAVVKIGAWSEPVALEAREVIEAAQSTVPVVVRPRWYF